MAGSASILSVCDLIRNYLQFCEASCKHARRGEISPNYDRLERGLPIMEKYPEWSVGNFSLDGRRSVLQAMIVNRYARIGSAEFTNPQLTRQ